MTFELGQLVHDTEDENPEKAVVILTPDAAISEWTVNEYNEDGEKIGESAVADYNPEYPETENVVVVAFTSSLQEKLVWDEITVERLFKTVCAAGIKFYGFPESRLEQVEA